MSERGRPFGRRMSSSLMAYGGIKYMHQTKARSPFRKDSDSPLPFKDGLRRAIQAIQAICVCRGYDVQHTSRYALK